MSHKATVWLASLEPKSMTAGQFRVMFHLCDCHNPSGGCFPSQEYLREATGLSNGGLNDALNALEARGHLVRHRTRDGKTKRQNPTRYILGFEMTKPQEPTPETGDGNQGSEGARDGVKSGASQLRSTGDGAVSSFGGDPSPVFGKSRLQSTGEEPVKEPVNNPGPQKKRKSGSSLEDVAAFWAKQVKAGGVVPQSAMTPAVVDAIRRAGLLSEDELARCGVATPGRRSA